MSDDERDTHGDENEAQRAMGNAAERKAEKMKLEMEEYEESRREAREKEAEDIENLRKKRIERKIEREQEEKKLAEQRREEDARRKQEEEERKRKKAEEEAKRKAERAAKLKELEEKKKMAKVPNFVIKKKEGESGDTPKESAQKSKEQLEEEKRAILAQRITALSVDGLNAAGLVEKAKELHDKLLSLAHQKYDLEERYKRQQYDMIELAERARQMKGNKNKRGLSAQVDESFDRLADKFPSAPPKIQLCSKYERHTDQRTYGARVTLFEEFQKEAPLELKKEGELNGDVSGEGETAVAEEENDE